MPRMGGPRAWKEAQKKQQEYQQSGWDEERNNNNDSDDDDDNEKKDVEKRDLYAEYGVDLETENEKSQREKGVGDTGEMPGQEDVCYSLKLYLWNEVLIGYRNSRWL